MLETHIRIGREVFLGAFFGGALALDPTAMRRLLFLLRDEEFREGDVVYRQGDPAERVYFFDRARIHLVRDGAPAWTYVGRWIVGMADVVVERPRSRTAIALANFKGASIAAAEWLDFVEDASETPAAITTQARSVAALYESAPEIGHVETPAPGRSRPERALSLLEKLFVLFDMPILRRAGVQTLAVIAGRAQEIRLGPGEELFSLGGPRDRLFVVVHGEVACGVATYPAGTVVEGAGALAGGLNTHKAVAEGEVIVLAIAVEEWFDAMEEHAELLRCTLRWFSLERERVLDALAARQGDLVLE